MEIGVSGKFYAALVTAGFVAVLGSAQEIERSIVSGGMTRTYLEYICSACTSGSDVPLVIVCHPGLSTAQQVASSSKFTPKAEKENFIVVYPQGIRNQWNAYNKPNSQRPDDFAFINELIDTMLLRYPIDTNRVYMCGFSNGAWMTFRMACDATARFAAIGPISGAWKYGKDGMTGDAEYDCKPSKKLPVMFYRGTSEDNLPTGRDSLDKHCEIFWSKWNSCNPTPIIDTIKHNGDIIARERYYSDDDTPTVIMNVIGNSHLWHASATDMIWEFFSKYPRDNFTKKKKEINLPEEKAVKTRHFLFIVAGSKQPSHAAFRIFDIRGRDIRNHSNHNFGFRIMLIELDKNLFQK